LNDGEVAGGQNGSHQAASSISRTGEPDAGSPAKIVLFRRQIVSLRADPGSS
jgi:hypothetical protein